VPHQDFFARQQPAGEGGSGIQPGYGLLLATDSTPTWPTPLPKRFCAPASPLTKGRDDQRDASRKPSHFFHGSKIHQPLLQQAFQEITRQNLPTRLGEDP